MLDRLVTALPAAGVVALSRRSIDAQRRLWPRRRTRLVYPGADLDEFDPDRLPDQATVRSRLQLPLGSPVIGIVGRLQSWKGFHVAVEAMPIVLAEHPDTQLIIVGGTHPLEPGYEQELRALAESLHLTSHVHLVGLQRNVAEWMHAMDVVVMASYDEPFGIVVIEAMALGRPVIASDSGGPTEIITPGTDGLLFRTGDSSSLAQTLLTLFRQPELAHEIAQNARRRAQDFSATAYARSAIRAAAELATDQASRRRQARHEA